MPILEDDVKEAMRNWLHTNNCTNIKVSPGTAAAFDVQGIQETALAAPPR